MRADDVRSNEPIRYGAYLCLHVPAGALDAVAGADVPALAERLELRSEFEPGNGDPPRAIAYLRRIGATPGTPGDMADDGLLHAGAVVHVAAETSAPVAELCAGLACLLGPEIDLQILSGVVRPTLYTGNLMHNLAYAHRVLQQPGTVMPNAFLLPTKKSAEWWTKDWMERHTYFLPRYDESGRKASDGHALTAAAGVDSLMRRTYKNLTEPAPAGEYDFINYFECADADVPVFHEVRGALRDVARNPEWKFVREGPTWHGRRVAAWADLFRAG
ncbi:MAG TPA: hypothetical protein VGM86_14445 [Thermoanaerobaculia bacterium]|jgi:hypothetical protein